MGSQVVRTVATDGDLDVITYSIVAGDEVQAYRQIATYIKWNFLLIHIGLTFNSFCLLLS